jgi:O-antigen/teichoic acid export membrane protein
LAEAGYFSLASDIGLRLFGTLGATIEIVALRHVLSLGEKQGRDVALAQVSRNIVVVLAVVLPAAAGFWVVLPAFEALLVPPEFRGRFAAHLSLLLPGFAALAIFQAALYPVFLLDKRTLVTTLAALLGLAANLAVIVTLSATLGRFAASLAQSAAFLTVLLLTAVLVLRALPKRPSLKDITAVVVATGAMAALLWPLQGRFAAPAELLIQAVLGVAIYGGLILACNVAGWRSLLLRRLSRRG